MSRKGVFLLAGAGLLAWSMWKSRQNFVDYGVSVEGLADNENNGGFIATSLNNLTGINIGEGVNDNLVTSLAGINYLKEWENPNKKGRDAKTGLWFEHDDGAGIPTIGYGHKIKPLENFSGGLTDVEVERLFVNDLSIHAEPIYTLVKVPLSQNQFDALVSFVFNVGAGQKGFRGSKLLKLLNQGLYSEAADQFMRWVYAKGVPVRGLYNRRYSDMQVFRSGIYKKWTAN